MNKDKILFVDLHSWDVENKFLDTSGRSEKVWISNKEFDKIGLFKYPKTDFTYEHISEHLAYQIAKIMNIECAESVLGIFNNRKGSLSMLVNSEDEDLIEGVVFIQAQFSHYDADKLIDTSTGQKYSIEMIRRSLINNTLRIQFMDVLLFDFIIGNSDRHQNNWALISNPITGFKLSPLYDNGSSLCAYIPEENIRDILRDKMRFDALVDSKSHSCIGINNIKKPRHSDVIRYILQKKYISVEYTLKLTGDLEKEIPKLIKQYSEIISENRMELLQKFLLSKIELLEKICREECFYE